MIRFNGRTLEQLLQPSPVSVLEALIIFPALQILKCAVTLPDP